MSEVQTHLHNVTNFSNTVKLFSIIYQLLMTVQLMTHGH